MNELISVVIPIKNMELYIADCLDSIVNSTERPLEVIIVDFGSEDRSIDIVHRYEQRYPCIRLVQDFGGDAASSRNMGLSLATGEYVSFIDCDDWIAPNMLEVLYNKIKQGNYDLVSCNYMNVFVEKQVPVNTQSQYAVRTTLDNMNQVLSWMALGGMGAEIWTKLYRTEYLKENQILFESENGINGEDVFFNYCVLLHQAKICTIDDVLYYHRIRNNSLSRRRTDCLTKRFITIVEKLLCVADDLKLDISQGIGQLLISLIIQDVVSQEAKKDKLAVLEKYLENEQMLKLCRQAVVHPCISIKRRVLCILLALKQPKIIVYFVN